MRKVYYIFSESTGEEDWFFDEADAVVARWSCNDAAWRPEYMDRLLRWAGVEVVPLQRVKGKSAKAHAAKLLAIVKDTFIKEQGYDPETGEDIE